MCDFKVGSDFFEEQLVGGEDKTLEESKALIEWMLLCTVCDNVL